MQMKRFIVELGTGADLHGMDATKAACRAVRDAIGRSCLCGLVEILGKSRFEGVHVAVQIACPFPDRLDTEKILAEVPIGTRSLTAVPGGMLADGICVDAFARDCDTILVANAAVTVSVDPSSVN